VLSEGSPCVHIIKMSSIYLFQSSGVRWVGAWVRRECSRSDRKMLAKEGAMRVPMAVPKT